MQMDSNTLEEKKKILKHKANIRKFKYATYIYATQDFRFKLSPVF